MPENCYVNQNSRTLSATYCHELRLLAVYNTLRNVLQSNFSASSFVTFEWCRPNVHTLTYSQSCHKTTAVEIIENELFCTMLMSLFKQRRCQFAFHDSDSPISMNVNKIQPASMLSKLCAEGVLA